MTMLRPCVVTILFMLMSGVCHPAKADWGSAGAQVICQSNPALFRIIPSDLSSADPANTTHILPGYKRLSEGVNRLSCVIGPYKLQVMVKVIPAGNGQCEGAGVVMIDSISAKQVELTPDSPLLEWSCQDSTPSLVDLQVRMHESGVAITRCYEDPTADTPRAQQCETKSFDVDTIAMAIAKIDHDLADPAAQAASLATKLPREQDLSHLVGRESTKDGAPACAHWSTDLAFPVVQDLDSPGDGNRHGRIAGTVGERVYLQATYPLLCGRDNHDGCKSSAYVTPGDRVDMGFICGGWTYVRYESRLRSLRDTVGWVPTRRLYAVDPVHETPLESPRPARSGSSGYPKDSMEDAVWRGDIPRVVTLLGQMERAPQSPLHAPCPLARAVEQDDKDMVKVMLDHGVDPNEEDYSKNCSPSLLSAVHSGASTAVIDLLLKAGADVNGIGTPSSPMILLVQRTQIYPGSWLSNDAMQRELTTPYDLAQRFLAHGANPNWKTPAGETALVEAVKANQIDVALLLLNKGADPNLETPLLAAIDEYGSRNDPTLFVALLDHGANPNPKVYTQDMHTEYRETTPLIEAASAGNYTFAKLLLEHGADPSAALDDGATALSTAMKNGHQDVADLIKKYSEKESR